MATYDVETFYRENYESYVKRISRKAGSIENAEDIIQEAFYRALKYIDAYDSNISPSFETWFNTLVNRALFDFKRIETKQGMTAATDTGETEAVEMDGVGKIVADGIMEEIKTRRQDDHKQILWLYFVRNYPPRDIVQILDLHYRKVYPVIVRFKEEMRGKYVNNF